MTVHAPATPMQPEPMQPEPMQPGPEPGPGPGPEPGSMSVSDPGAAQNPNAPAFVQGAGGIANLNEPPVPSAAYMDAPPPVRACEYVHNI